MKISRIASVLAVALVTAVAAWVAAQAQGNGSDFVVIKPAAIQWVDVPAIPGVQGAVLEGDPERPGPYVVRARFAPGAMTRPHRHSADRYVIVISGTWYVGTSDRFDPGQTDGLPAGSFMKNPAMAVHYDGARDEEVVVQISGIGPVTTEFLDAGSAD